MQTFSELFLILITKIKPKLCEEIIFIPIFLKILSLWDLYICYCYILFYITLL